MPAVTKRENTREKEILSQLCAGQCVLFVGGQGFGNTGAPGGRTINQRCLALTLSFPKRKWLKNQISLVFRNIH